MDKIIKKQIDRLRSAGMKPTAIAERLGISVNTVKSHMRRSRGTKEDPRCLFCGRPVRQNPGRKLKKYCSDSCRCSYWNMVRRTGNGL